MNENFTVFPLLRRQYRIILVLLFVFAVMVPFYFKGTDLLYAYIPPLFLALATFGLHQGFFFQKLHKRLRPFIVARIAQAAAAVSSLLLVVLTFNEAREAWIFYGILWLVAFLTVWQYFGIFKLAEKSKKKHPEVCDFC